MDEVKQNYYGSLCSDMYEILHKQAPQDELNFYLSYAEKGKKILEPLYGSGRFLIPFLERGFDIYGIDLSKEIIYIRILLTILYRKILIIFLFLQDQFPCLQI